MADDEWAPLADRFVDQHYGSLRGRVRTHVIHEHLRHHLGPAPPRVVDVGGGAGHQSLPLARAGYEVTIVDPSPAMLERAAQRLTTEDDTVAARVRLVRASGEDAPRCSTVQRSTRSSATECSCTSTSRSRSSARSATSPLLRGVVSIVAKNAEVMAMRHAHEGDWAGAIAAFDPTGRSTASASTPRRPIDHLSTLISNHGVEPTAWYGVRLFTDGWTPDRPNTDPDDLVLPAELMASQRDPYRRLSRLFHLVGRRSN